MARKTKTADGEQLDLIDVEPENAKAIKRAARAYKSAQAQRITWLVDEKKHKGKILELVKEAKLRPNEDGIIKFRLDGIVVAITPRDELVQIKTTSDEAEEPEE